MVPGFSQARTLGWN